MMQTLLLNFSVSQQLFVVATEAGNCLDYDPKQQIISRKHISTCLLSYGDDSWLYEINKCGVVAKSSQELSPKFLGSTRAA